MVVVARLASAVVTVLLVAALATSVRPVVASFDDSSSAVYDPLPMPASYLTEPRGARRASTAASSPSTVSSSAGHLVRSSFPSRVLSRQMPYLVYLPPGYEASAARYPVLYMLHGINGSYEEWLVCGLIAAAEEMILDGRIQPLIIVLPQGDRGYYINHSGGGPRWADYILREVVPLVDASYRTIPSRAGRAIGGDSMGGHGALQLAINNPELFGTIGAHSPALRRLSETFPFFGDAAYFARHDPLTLARTSEAVNQLSIWIDTGAEDPWRRRAADLHDALNERGVPHRWRLLPGRHDRAYWRANVGDYLLFYSRSLVPSH